MRWIRRTNNKSLRADFIAGLTGAIIVLPQAIAFAAIAGLPPEYGLYTAMITPIIAALFGSSNHLVSGPTTAISIVIFATVSQHANPGSAKFIEYALTLTFLAGLYQFIFGLVRLGRIVNFVSHNVIVGFTTGAALLIAESQFTKVLGIETMERGENLIDTITTLANHLHLTNPYALSTAAITIAIAILVKLFTPRLPHLLAAMIGGGLYAFFIDGQAKGMEFVEAVPASLPPLSAPVFSFSTLSILAPEALAIALLGLIEAVSISRSAATQSGQRINPNQEFIGQGLSNLVGSFFSSYAGSGSFTRSGVNLSAGAKTPLSAIFASILLMVIVLIFAPLTVYLPKAAMGAVILIVAYNLINPSYILKVLRISRRESGVLFVTFAATLFLDLEFAIYAGVLLSLSLFLMRTSTPEIVAMAPDHNSPKKRMGAVHDLSLTECPQIKIIRIDMSVYFGSIHYIEEAFRSYTDYYHHKHILILANSINFIDMSGAEMLAAEAKRLSELGGGLYLCELKPGAVEFLETSGFIKDINADHIFKKKSEAIAQITKRLSLEKCQHCSAKIFSECEALSQKPIEALSKKHPIAKI